MTERLAGHVDRADGQMITGWVANMDRPGALEPVVCGDRGGRSVEFSAWHMREDVCRVLGRNGRFGFVVPVSSLEGLSSPVTLRDRLGTVLPGGAEIALSAERGGKQGSPPVIFLHIPKTAGTSVRNAIIEGLLPSERLFIYPPPFGLLIGEFAALPIAQRQAARLVVGHAHYGLHQFLPKPARYATFLREPMARLRSQAAHHARAGTVFTWNGSRLPLERVIEQGLDEQFDNLMVRVIAGLPNHLAPLGTIGTQHLDAARRAIEMHFDFVGSVETMEADMPRLASVLGRDVPMPRRENVNADRSWLEGSALAIDWDRVEERNRFDRLLWEQAHL